MKKTLWTAVWMWGAASGEILWKGSFESGDLSEWSGTLNPAKGERRNIIIVGTPVFEGKSAAQITIHPDDIFPNGHNRVELRHDGRRTGEGETTLFSWRFQLAANAGVHQDIAYWETKGPEYRQSMAFSIDPSGARTQIGFRTNLPEPRQHWSAPLSVERWHQIAMRIVWSQSADRGRVSVWFDGKLVVADAVARTKPNGADLFIQAGFHRDSAQSPIETIFVDDAIEGTSAEDVLFPNAQATNSPSSATGRRAPRA